MWKLILTSKNCSFSKVQENDEKEISEMQKKKTHFSDKL